MVSLTVSKVDLMSLPIYVQVSDKNYNDIRLGPCEHSHNNVFPETQIFIYSQDTKHAFHVVYILFLMSYSLCFMT